MAGAAAGGRQRDAGLIPVLGLVVVQLAVAALLWGALPQRAPFIRPFPWPVLAGLFALSEAFVIHLHLRRESQGISLSEISLVLGLLFAAPLELAVARLVGELPVFLRRQTPLKAVFNLAQHAAAVGLAGTVYAAVLGGAPPLSTRGWVAAYLAAGGRGRVRGAARDRGHRAALRRPRPAHVRARGRLRPGADDRHGHARVDRA